jgi:glucarate dehydratase
MLEALRAAIGPQRRIRIDANEGWTMSDAVRLLNRWNPMFDIEFAEGPIRCEPELLRELTTRSPVSICANEGLEGVSNVMRMLDLKAVDYLCFSSTWVGSLRRFMMLCQVAEYRNVRVCKHTHGEVGLAAAAHQHAMIAAPLITEGNQQVESILTDNILTERLPIASSATWGVIEKPGLGVEVDGEKLARYGEAFERDGQFLPYDLSKASA